MYREQRQAKKSRTTQATAFRDRLETAADVHFLHSRTDDTTSRVIHWSPAQGANEWAPTVTWSLPEDCVSYGLDSSDEKYMDALHAPIYEERHKPLLKRPQTTLSVRNLVFN